jgi:hypothetical protein
MIGFLDVEDVIAIAMLVGSYSLLVPLLDGQTHGTYQNPSTRPRPSCPLQCGSCTGDHLVQHCQSVA